SDVPDAMTSGFLADQDAHLAERLLSGLEAGAAAGGEEGPVHSAALLVVDRQPFPLVDLRVDWDDTMPIARLPSLWQAYEGQMTDYLDRAIDPAKAPSCGVAGDPLNTGSYAINCMSSGRQPAAIRRESKHLRCVRRLSRKELILQPHSHWRFGCFGSKLVL
ncbi:MAG: DUF1028 domain-containing protein, partial [Geminicoccaceae bacterium]